MFSIKYSNQAKKFLKKIDKVLAKRILDKIARLQGNPLISDSEKMGGRKLFKTRIGKYRILYEVDYGINMVGIVKIDKRSRVYK